MDPLQTFFTCDLCGYKTTQRRYLQAHQKRKTPCAPVPAQVASEPVPTEVASESAPISTTSTLTPTPTPTPNIIHVGHGSNARVLTILCLQPDTIEKTHDAIYALDSAIRQPLSVPLDQARRLFDILQTFVGIYHEMIRAYQMQEQLQEAAARGDVIAA